MAMNNERIDKINMLLLVVGLPNEMRWITIKLFEKTFLMVNCNQFGEGESNLFACTKAKTETRRKGQSHVALYYQLVLHFNITNTENTRHMPNAHRN